MTKLPDLLTVDEVAKMFRVHAKTVNKWIEEGLLDFIRTPGGRARILSNQPFIRQAAASDESRQGRD